MIWLRKSYSPLGVGWGVGVGVGFSVSLRIGLSRSIKFRVLAELEAIIDIGDRHTDRTGQDRTLLVTELATSGGS